MKNTQSQFQITLLYDVAYLFNLFRSNNKGKFLEILHWSAQTDSLVKALKQYLKIHLVMRHIYHHTFKMSYCT
jgi:hypothetical protein